MLYLTSVILNLITWNRILFDTYIYFKIFDNFKNNIFKRSVAGDSNESKSDIYL